MMNIDNLRNGRHTIQVYDMSSNRGFSIFQKSVWLQARPSNSETMM
jgi:hypothetical protein